MVKFVQLLTGKIPGLPSLNAKLVKKQKLASATAWQILNYYSNRKIPKEWLKYNYLRGVLFADEVGGGKTFEALATISQAFLSSTNNKIKRFRVLILAAPAIRSKWEWKEQSEKEKWCDLKRFIEQAQLSKSKKDLLESLFKTAQGENIITSKGHWKYRYNNSRQGIWIASFGALPSTKGRKPQALFKRDRYVQFPTGSFDYIIADEAHIVKSGYIDSDENISTTLNNSAIRKIHAVLNENRKAKLLLLTATPFQNNLNEFIHILSFVEHPNEQYPSVVKIIDKGLRKLNEKIDSLQTENSVGREMIRELINFFDDEIGHLICNANELPELFKRPKDICKNGRRSGLDDFLRDVMIRNNKEPLNVVPKELLLDDEEKLQYLLFRDVISKKQEDEKDMFSVKLSQLVSSDDAFSKSFLRPSTQKKKILCYKDII